MLSLIVREVAKVLAPSMAIYCLLLAFSMVLYPPRTLQRLDTKDANGSFLNSSPAYIVHKSTLLSSNKPTVVLIGPSNVQEGFNAAIVSQRMEGTDVHIASVGGGNIDDMMAIIDLVYTNYPPQKRDNVTFVMGLWYGEFLHAESSKERTLIAQQMGRFGLFKYTDDGYERNVSGPTFDVLVNLLRPFFLLHGSLRRNSILIQVWEKYRGSSKAKAEAKPLECTKELRQHLSETAKTSHAVISKSQFGALVDLSARVATKGGRLVLVDLPISKCLKITVSHWQDYQRLKTEYIASATVNGAAYLNFQDMDDDNSFNDAVHPLPDAAKRMSRRLASELKAIPPSQ